MRMIHSEENKQTAQPMLGHGSEQTKQTSSIVSATRYENIEFSCSQQIQHSIDLPGHCKDKIYNRSQR